MISISEINLIIDTNTVNKYNEYYFLNHPKARVCPVKHPYHPSLNEWMIMKRPRMNALKQKWKDFGVWFINDCGYSNLKIDNCSILFTVYFNINRRRDLDNMTQKFIIDSFVESGFIVDDDYKHVAEITMRCGYDKDNPRTEIKIIY